MGSQKYLGDRHISGGERVIQKKPKSAKSKKVTKAKKLADPQEIQRRRQKYAVRGLFRRLGFGRVNSNGKEFTFKGRTGELDDIFVYENIVIVAEYTVGKPSSSHIAKKTLLYDLIDKNQEEWIKFCEKNFDSFPALAYLQSDYRVRICYFSLYAVSDEIDAVIDYVFFLNGTKFRYFDALTKTIHKSARFELFKYLDLDFKEIGHEIKNSSSTAKTFLGHVLPESYSSFPNGFKVVSFYADPNTLLTMAYVLRRDSWRDQDGLYQRVLLRGRMRQMRRYLTTEERVFVNNIIVTLPNDTKLNEPDDPGKNVDVKSLKKVRDVAIAIPFRSDALGIVDGQHRVFCYHEGDDSFEEKIGKLRDRQNLLVTGIVYPSTYSEADRRRFEAKLFLEINDTQRRTRSDLKQSIELILTPYSTIAIAKSVIHRLNQAGALRGMLQTNYFDPPRLIRTSSIVAYGLRPLVKLSGDDSLFSAWKNPNKQRLYDLQHGKADPANLEPILGAYIEYCVDSINDVLIAAKKAMGSSKWALADKPKDRILNPTVINGLIVALRLLVKKSKPYSMATYEKKLAGLSTFNFSKYKSSSWSALGTKISDDFL